ncbi:glutathione S-transferase family protein [Salinarimonas ramus]|uniref:Glutathione S-transferase n=1 Tax=Salinarimonas ramus TaxID=690164 RepID=A0A917V4U1_9HYPH|nr:glutathione S-transferase family protein [Salinarimonas ramus]GGK37512.1 glutathione S-transferase [Salinarimonas ramus]
MSDALVLYTNPMSRGRIARWMLEEVGASYTTEIVDYGEAMQGAAFRAINPMAKVPALKHGDTVITEGAAICAYLADAFPQAGLAPEPGSRERGTYYRWMFFAAGPIEAAVTHRALGYVPPQEKSRMVGYGSYERMLDTLEGALGAGPYLLGERFSAADVLVGAQVGWGVQFGTIETRPAFEAYAARCMSRPAAIRAKEMDDALLPPLA